MLPVLLLLLDYWPLRRLRLRTALEKWPYFLLSLGFGIVTLVSHERTVGVGVAAASEALRWPLQVAYLVGFYALKIVWPADLSPVYASPEPLSLSHPGVRTGVAVACALTVLCVLLVRRTRGPLTGWLFFVAALAPTLGFLKYSWVIASDKYVYFPALGLLMLLTAGIAAAWRSPALRGIVPKTILPVLLVTVPVLEARGTRAALDPWRDSPTLWRHIVGVAPEAPAAHIGLGVALEERGKREEAIHHLQRAVELGPDYTEAHLDLGILLDRQGQPAEAVHHLREAIRLDPNWADPWNQLAWLLATCPDSTVRDPDEAMRLAGRAVELSSARDANVLDTQAAAQAAAGRFGRAVETARRALAVARAIDDESLAHTIRLRLAMYERGIAYVESSERHTQP
jgi:Tfp pilus assembly protein PilF